MLTLASFGATATFGIGQWHFGQWIFAWIPITVAYPVARVYVVDRWLEASTSDGRMVVLWVLYPLFIAASEMWHRLVDLSHNAQLVRPQESVMLGTATSAIFALIARMFLVNLDSVSDMVYTVILFGLCKLSTRVTRPILPYAGWFLLSGGNHRVARARSELYRSSEATAYQILAEVVSDFSVILITFGFTLCARGYYSVTIDWRVFVALALQLAVEVPVQLIATLAEEKFLDIRLFLTWAQIHGPANQASREHREEAVRVLRKHAIRVAVVMSVAALYVSRELVLLAQRPI